jgi:hypothetical protein
MSDHIIYVPVLKGKQGEFGALQSLDERWRSMIKPCIEVPAVAYDFENKKPKVSLDRHLAAIADKLRRSWGPSPFFLDLSPLPSGARTEDGTHPADRLFDVCKQKGLRPIPVSTPQLDNIHQDALARKAKEHGNGLCLRLLVEVLLDGDPVQIIKSLMARVKITDRANTDIILDVDYVMGSHVTAVRNGVLSVLSRLPGVEAWRSVTLVGCGFPENLIGLTPGTVVAFPRTEWMLWKGMSSKDLAPARMPTFGDYAIQHPTQKEVDQRVVGPSASIRYTTNGQWLIFRGRGVRTPKSGGLSQYKKLSQDLIAHEDYSGKEFCWGDRYISDCARGAVSTGGMPLWRQIGTNHHITFVSHQVSSFLGSSRRF